MDYINIDGADESVKQFLQSLPIPTGGAVVGLGGRPLLQVFPADNIDENRRRSLIERGRALVQRVREQNRNLSPEYIEAEVQAAIEQVRQRNAV
jgi:hypothetical protein